MRPPMTLVVGKGLRRRGSAVQQAQIQTQGARLLRTIAEVLLDPSIPPDAVRQEIFRRIPREQVSAALEQTSALENSEAEALFQELRQRYSYIRSFAPQVLRTLSCGSPRAGNEVLQALEVLARMNAHRQLQVPAEAPSRLSPRAGPRLCCARKGPTAEAGSSAYCPRRERPSAPTISRSWVAAATQPGTAASIARPPGRRGGRAGSPSEVFRRTAASTSSESWPTSTR